MFKINPIILKNNAYLIKLSERQLVLIIMHSLDKDCNSENMFDWLTSNIIIQHCCFEDCYKAFVPITYIICLKIVGLFYDVL